MGGGNSIDGSSYSDQLNSINIVQLRHGDALNPNAATVFVRLGFIPRVFNQVSRFLTSYKNTVSWTVIPPAGPLDKVEYELYRDSPNGTPISSHAYFVRGVDVLTGMSKKYPMPNFSGDLVGYIYSGKDGLPTFSCPPVAIYSTDTSNFPVDYTANASACPAVSVRVWGSQYKVIVNGSQSYTLTNDQSFYNLIGTGIQSIFAVKK